MSQDRKTSFKVPPPSVREAKTSQAMRRERALQEQKRRRAERIDSARQLDIFADLSLGQSDDDGDEPQDAPEVVREGIGQFASMLSTSSQQRLEPVTQKAGAVVSDSVMQTDKKRPKSKRKGKGRGATQQDQGAQAQSARAPTKPRGQKKPKPSKWAEKCMYAELLEMHEGFDASGTVHDGIPDDIETAWVAVAPVPVGKRCIAVTHQASGVAGIAPNTTLRSRVLGKALMKPFPSPLPSQTVLDCILDDNWRENGILHVLDVLSWKAQDVADCETPFRFWWRDTRLSELAPFPPPSTATPAGDKYQFPYPTTFAPIPYHTDTSLAHLASTLVPLTRTPRAIPISVPDVSPAAAPPPSEDGAMDLDHAAPIVQLSTVAASTLSDGLLLYVAQASYEPGTSPLSTWVPLRAYQTRDEQQSAGEESTAVAESPLDIFERLVRRRLAIESGGVPEVEMAS